MSKRKIYFRADAGYGIGYGHFIRTLALADMLRNEFECTFFTSSPTPYQIGELEKVCNYISLNENTKFKDFLTYLNGDEIVVLDNYFYTTEYQRDIKNKGCKLVCIDEMPTKRFEVDILICPDPYSRKDFDISDNALFLSGLEWNILRSPFLTRTKESLNSNIRDVIIMMGGEDPYNINERILNYLLKNTVWNFNVVCNRKQKEFLHFNYRIKKYSKLCADDLAEIYYKSDFGIFPASNVCIEALAMKLPISIGYYAENQHYLYNYLTRNFKIIGLGNLLDSDLERRLDSLFLNKLTFNNFSIKFSSQKDNVLNIFSKL